MDISRPYFKEAMNRRSQQNRVHSPSECPVWLAGVYCFSCDDLLNRTLMHAYYVPIEMCGCCNAH